MAFGASKRGAMVRNWQCLVDDDGSRDQMDEAGAWMMILNENRPWWKNQKTFVLESKII